MILDNEGDIHALFESVDVDNGKEINFNEFLAATLGKRALDERRLRLAFDRLDFDHSGTIDGKRHFFCQRLLLLYVFIFSEHVGGYACVCALRYHASLF